MNREGTLLLLKPIDWITLLFCSWMLMLIAVGMNSVNEPIHHFIIYFTIFTGILVLVWFTEFMRRVSAPEACSLKVCRTWRPRAYAVVSFIRQYYPVLLYLYFFESVSATNRVFFHDWLDPFFYGIDQRIFGYLPSLEWARMYGGFWVQELFHFAYFCYYPMIIGLPILMYIKRRDKLDELVFVLSFVFYICYFIYSWLPVIGGRFFPEAMEWTRQVQGGPFTRLMAIIYINSPHLGGAFPSSHVAIALVLSLMGLRYFPKLGYVMLTISFFLALGTVYCHYHWFIDTVFGVITGLLGYLLAHKVYRTLLRQSP